MMNETKLLGCWMQACQQLLYRGTLVVLERLSSIYGDDSVSQEALLIILEVIGYVQPLLPMIAILSCSTYVTVIWQQLQLEDGMVFIHRLSEIGWDKTFNLFMHTDCTSVKFSPDIIKWQRQDWCHRHLYFRYADWDLILFYDECWFNQSHADWCERIYHHGGVHFAVLLMRASLSGTISEVVQS